MIYDVIIIGSGPAGISASLYAKRANLSVLIVSKGIGTLEKVEMIDNYYGLQSNTTGKQLQKNGEEQAKRLGVEFKNEEVVKVDYDINFKVNTINHIYESKVVILATGSKRKTPNIKGIKELDGKGISYCATCDAFFFKGKDVGVLGSKEYAIHEAEELLPVVNSVTILTNGEIPVEKRSQNIKIEEKRIREFRGIERIEEIEFEDNTTKKIDGVFVAIDTASSSDLARKLGIMLDENNNIRVDSKMQTNLPGLFACGDCTGGILQIAKAVNEGMIAGMSAIKFLKDNKGE